MASPEDLLLQAQAHARRQQQHAGDHDHVEHHSAQRRDEEVSAGIGHADSTAARHTSSM